MNEVPYGQTTKRERELTVKMLLTGATGVIGSEVAARLHVQGVQLRLLTRGKLVPGIPHDMHVVGDLREPDLGLSAAEYRRLGGSIDRILHVASVVDFDMSAEGIIGTNVNGTAAITALADRFDAELAFVSTAYTAQFLSASRVSGTGCCLGRDAYLASKVAADHIVSSSRVPFQILKPSILIGHSENGNIKRSQGLHTFMDLYARGEIPFFPGTENTRIDFVPVDKVADEIAESAIRDELFDGSTRWITAGQNAPTVDIFRGWIDEALDREPADLRYMSVDTVQRLILPAFVSGLDDRTRRRFENLLALVALFNEDAMPSSPGNGSTVDETLLRRSVWHAMGWLAQEKEARVSA